jgi:hypothetical protein
MCNRAGASDRRPIAQAVFTPPHGAGGVHAAPQRAESAPFRRYWKVDVMLEPGMTGNNCGGVPARVRPSDTA